jgi:putative acetyltransferase
MTNQQIQLTKETVHPWAIVRLLPNAQCYTVARFYNRQDAQDHRRFLHRWMPAAEFEIVFDLPVGNN